MSLNAAAIEYLLSKGLTGDDLLEVAQRIESGEKKRSAGAERQARYRKKKAQGVTDDVTSDVTCDVTSPLKDKSKPLSSVSIETGGSPNAVKLMFDAGVRLLTSTGTPEKQARALVGQWRKAVGDDEVRLGLAEAQVANIVDPIPWLTKRFSGPRKPDPENRFAYMDHLRRELAQRASPQAAGGRG